MLKYSYLIPTMEDYKTKVVVQPGDDPADARIVSLASLMNFAYYGGNVSDIETSVLRAIVHDYLLLTGAVRPTERDGGKGAADASDQLPSV